MKEESKNNIDVNQIDYLDDYIGKDILADNLIFMGGRKTESLNGPWNYAVDQYDCCLNQKWFLEIEKTENGFTYPHDYSFDTWPVMNLPCNWNMVEDKLFLYEGPMVFTRTFGFNKRENEKVFLRVGAANYACRIFLNKQFIGAHFGGSTPFIVDITDYLEVSNRILFVVDNTRRADQVPMNNTDWYNYGGIYRDIEILRLPNVFIKDFKIALVPDGKYNKIQALIRLSEPKNTEAQLKIEGLSISHTVAIQDGFGEIVFDATPNLWSPESPTLYKVYASIDNDSIEDRVGFREIKIEGHNFFINGKKTFLHGISCHEDSIVNGKAFTLEECKKIFSDAKELGCNFMRLAHYPHTEMMSKTADEVGILLWEEIPVYWHMQFSNPDTYQKAENMLMELITRDYNRASVIIWSVGNENPDTEARLTFMSKLATKAHETDRTRKIAAACLVSNNNAIEDRLADYLDVIGINEYIGWYVPDFKELPELFKNSKPTKPVIITEVGAGAKPGYHGPECDKFTEEYQAYVYQKQIDEIRKIPYIQGMTPWILYDFRCPRRTNVLQDYYNRKGLIAPDRKYKKMAFHVLQEFYKSFD